MHESSLFNLAKPPEPSSPIVQASGVGKSVKAPEGDISILNRIDLIVREGDSVAILGASGCGKTTLLGLLAGLDLPSQGNITLAGQLLNELDEEARAHLRAQYVGFIFQNFCLLPSLTAEENIALPLELTGQENPERVEQILEMVGLKHRRRHYPRQLSGGEQQRVALARAYVTYPRVLFADEPTGNLDQVTGRHVNTLLFDLNEKNNTTLILVTHDLTLAQQCRHIYRLSEGQLQLITEPSY